MTKVGGSHPHTNTHMNISVVRVLVVAMLGRWSLHPRSDSSKHTSWRWWVEFFRVWKCVYCIHVWNFSPVTTPSHSPTTTSPSVSVRVWLIVSAFQIHLWNFLVVSADALHHPLISLLHDRGAHHFKSIWTWCLYVLLIGLSYWSVKHSWSIFLGPFNGASVLNINSQNATLHTGQPIKAQGSLLNSCLKGQRGTKSLLWPWEQSQGISWKVLESFFKAALCMNHIVGLGTGCQTPTKKSLCWCGSKSSYSWQIPPGCDKATRLKSKLK